MLQAARAFRAAFFKKPINKTSMTKNTFLIAIAFLLCLSLPLRAQDYVYDNGNSKTGLVLENQSKGEVVISFSMQGFSLQDIAVDGEPMKNIVMNEVFLPNEAGAPNLPALSRYVAIPEGASAKIVVKEIKFEILKNVNIAPAPPIPLDTDRNPPPATKDAAIYSRDAFYPQQPVQLSETTQIRGVDAVMVGVVPFQYNPVTRELKVINKIEITLSFEGGKGTFGEERLRSRWFDPVLRQTLMNYESIPEIDYSKQAHLSGNPKTDGCEYLIVTPNDPAWQPFAEQIKDFRTKQGISTKIVTLAEIGGYSAAELESYFNNAYNTWDVPPVAVLLMADYGSNPANSITSPMWNYYCVSDNIYADVNYNNLPDIIFARMTAQNTTQLQTMVSKMIDYETNPPTDFNFYHKPITALGWQTERWFQLCSETVGGFWREVQGKSPVRINDIYEGIPGSIWSTAQNTQTVVNYFGPTGTGYIPASPMQLGGWSGGNAQMIAAAVNDGAFALQHRDHGYEYGWGEPGFTNSSINNLRNNQNNELPFVFSINCLTGKYNIEGECFAEKFHRYTYNGLNAGALGVVAPSETSYSFVNDVFVWGMFDLFYPEFLPDYGPYVNGEGMMPAFGNAAGKYFLQQSAWPYNSGNKEVTLHLFHHHGGAFLNVFTEVPQSLSVVHPETIFSFQNEITIQANAGSLIALTVDGEILAVTKATGQFQNIPIDPLPAGSNLIVTITKQNFLRVESTVEIISPEGAYVVFDSFGINDGGSAIENGQLDYGESVGLDIALKNLGITQTGNVTATLSTPDAFVTITQNVAGFGIIQANSVVTMADAFSIVASENIPDGHIVNFEINATDGIKNWTTGFSLTANAPALEIAAIVVQDAAGNNDGFLDPGETAPVKIFIKNNGHAPALSAAALFTTTDSYLTLLTTTPQSYGALLPNQTRAATFVVSAAPSVPVGHVATATLALNADFGFSTEMNVQFDFSEYCIPTSNCSYGDGFRSFSLMEINNANNGCSSGGYGDFTQLVANLQPGETYTVNWKGGFSNQRASLWIDLNSNRAFEPEELLISDFVLASSSVVYSTNFVVPSDVNPGNKRLRIRAQYNKSSADPCSNFGYGETEDYTVAIANEAVAEQVITIPAGWSGLSSYLIPENLTFENIFGEVMDQVVIVQNSDGIFWPDQSINTLGNWNSFSGYTIKTSSEVTLSIAGEPLAPQAIQLQAGWNLMPVLSSCPVSVDELFNSFPDQLVVVKEIAGSGIYWPAQGINTLPVLLPGRSYFVFLNGNVFLEFEPCK